VDGARFDGLTRMWAVRGTRRKAALLLAGGPLGALLPFMAQSASAACGPPRAHCHKKTDCCTGRCNRKHHRCRGCGKGAKYCPATQTCIPADQCCGPCVGGTCQGGTCVCPTGQHDCNGNCQGCCVTGDCGAGGRLCINGSCACPEDMRDCHNGTCVAIGGCCTDDECNSGGGQVCVNGACVCPAGLKDCGDGFCIAQGLCCADTDCRSNCYQGACCTRHLLLGGLCFPLGSCSDPQGIAGCCQTDADCTDGCYQGRCCVGLVYESGLCGPRNACFDRRGTIANCCTTDDQCQNLCPHGTCCTPLAFEAGRCGPLGSCVCG
jgi:hypothetical protein